MARSECACLLSAICDELNGVGRYDRAETHCTGKDGDNTYARDKGGECWNATARRFLPVSSVSTAKILVFADSALRCVLIIQAQVAVTSPKAQFMNAVGVRIQSMRMVRHAEVVIVEAFSP